MNNIVNMGKNPKHLSKVVWEHYNGQVWASKCYVTWCNNIIHCMSSNWHLGHNIPESKGGETSLENLRPICSDCNLGMGSRMTIDEWTFKYVSTLYLEQSALDVLRGKFNKKKRKRCVI